MMRSVSIAVTAAAILLSPALAFAHLERPSYWPDPGPDNTVSPAAGGEVPTARSFASLATGAGPGDVLVVCKGEDGTDSLSMLRASVDEARKRGYQLRPSQPKTKLTKAQADQMLAVNATLAEQCQYDSVQQAVFDAGNHDRIAIMPGHYTEPESRTAPTNDPACDPSLLQEDASGDLTPSYEYQVNLSQRSESDLRAGPRRRGRPA